jgi:hypothetical protein
MMDTDSGSLLAPFGHRDGSGSGWRADCDAGGAGGNTFRRGGSCLLWQAKACGQVMAERKMCQRRQTSLRIGQRIGCFREAFGGTVGAHDVRDGGQALGGQAVGGQRDAAHATVAQGV